MEKVDQAILDCLAVCEQAETELAECDGTAAAKGFTFGSPEWAALRLNIWDQWVKDWNAATLRLEVLYGEVA